jgi:hypothetical protein
VPPQEPEPGTGQQPRSPRGRCRSTPPRRHSPQPHYRGNALAVIAATALFLLLVLSLLAA